MLLILQFNNIWLPGIDSCRWHELAEAACGHWKDVRPPAVQPPSRCKQWSGYKLSCTTGASQSQASEEDINQTPTQPREDTGNCCVGDHRCDWTGLRLKIFRSSPEIASDSPDVFFFLHILQSSISDLPTTRRKYWSIESPHNALSSIKKKWN